jgi:hypothetical protein
MKKVRVILSTPLIINQGLFEVKYITQKKAQEWIEKGPYENFSDHQTVKILGINPATARDKCSYYDESLCLKPLERLEFGREYSLEEIQEIGVDFVLIKRLVFK